MRPSSNVLRGLALAGAITALAGCSDYLDRRDMISVKGGDAVQTDKVTQMIDPWPRQSGDRNIAYNGEVIQNAYERYLTGRVIPPNSTGTSASYQPSNASNSAPPVGPSVTQAAAPTK
jgi:hypothetical protein